MVHNQVEDWSAELEDPPWIPSPAALRLAQTIQNNCPRMAAALEAAGILEPWAEMLDDKILGLAREFRMRHVAETANEAMSLAMMDLVPADWMAQEQWLAACSLDYEPMPDPDIYNPDEDDWDELEPEDEP